MNKRMKGVTRFCYRAAIFALGGGIYAALLILGPSIATAQSNPPAGTFVVRPAKVEITVAPGGTQTVIITLSNSTLTSLRLSTSVEDLASKIQSGPQDEPWQLLGDKAGQYSLKDLISFPSTSFNLPNGKEMQIPVTVRVPKDAEPGGRYGSVIFSFAPVNPTGQTQSVNIENRIATLFFVRIAGSAKEGGKLAAFGVFNGAQAISAPTPSLPLRFQVTFENTGNVHLDPSGKMTIRDMFGKTQDILIDPWAVLPNAIRMREIDWTTPLAVGYYTAHIDLDRGYQHLVDTQEVHFWVLPSVTQSIFVFIGLIIVAWLLRRSLRLSKNHVS